MTDENGPALSLTNFQDKMTDNKENIEKFSDILTSIETLDEKKRFLWKQIYENAVNDRSLANILYIDLWLQSQGNKGEHEKSGPILSKYLERMSKATDQLLKLAELLEEAERIRDAIDESSIFDQIGSGVKK